MKTRHTVYLVIIAHIGLFLIWMCMGGCSLNREQNAVDDIASRDVKIPTPEAEDIGVNTNIAVEDEKIIAQPDVTKKTPKVTKGAATAYDEATEVKYVVKTGDTLTKISRNFGVSIKEIQDRNDIQDPKTLREGREIYIPKRDGAKVEKEEPVSEKPIDEETKTTPDTAAKTETEASKSGAVTEPEKGTEPKEEKTAADTTGADESQYITHEVVQGDTVWKLARTYGVTTDDILKANNITDPTKIQIGQKLLIPKK